MVCVGACGAACGGGACVCVCCPSVSQSVGRTSVCLWWVVASPGPQPTRWGPRRRSCGAAHRFARPLPGPQANLSARDSRRCRECLQTPAAGQCRPDIGACRHRHTGIGQCPPASSACRHCSTEIDRPARPWSSGRAHTSTRRLVLVSTRARLLWRNDLCMGETRLQAERNTGEYDCLGKHLLND